MLDGDFSGFLCWKSNHGACDDLAIGRMAAYLVQNGRCYVSGVPLLENWRHLHHRLPREYGVDNSPANLVYLDRRIHTAIHTDSLKVFLSVLCDFRLTPPQLFMLSQLRIEARKTLFTPEEVALC